MPTLWALRAASVPRPSPLSGLPLSGLLGVLLPAHEDRLRENAPAPSNLDAVAARDFQGRVDGTPRAGIGCLT
jgi:hypothetical protein